MWRQSALTRRSVTMASRFDTAMVSTMPRHSKRVILSTRMFLCSVGCLLISIHVAAFAPAGPQWRAVPKPFNNASLESKLRELVKEKPLKGNEITERATHVFNPFNIASEYFHSPLPRLNSLSFAAAAVPLTALASEAAAASSRDLLSAGSLNPANFNPVCPASDTFYRGLQGGTQAIVGDEAFVEYGPLIAGGLLRIRLELCVVESFFNEAVGPFIEKNGLSWILPLHETVESFLAGVIFSLASTFILVGSTKIVSVIFIYIDIFLGLPSRVFGGFLFDRARGKPVTLDIGFGPFKTRVIGPGEVDEDTLIQNAGPFAFVVVLISGFVKLVGEISRVSEAVTLQRPVECLKLIFTETVKIGYQGHCRGN